MSETHEWVAANGDPWPRPISPPPVVDQQLAEASRLFGHPLERPMLTQLRATITTPMSQTDLDALDQEFRRTIVEPDYQFPRSQLGWQQEESLPRHRRQQVPYLMYPVYGFAVGLIVGVALITSWVLVEAMRDSTGAAGLVLWAGLGGALWGLIAGKVKGAPR